jgi:uncharacterized SAM-dependent methyltransferase
VILNAAPQIAVYVPIDISEDALEKGTVAISRDYPKVLVDPVAEDFTGAIRLPAAAQGRVKIGFFPGSTIGNRRKPRHSDSCARRGNCWVVSPFY